MNVHTYDQNRPAKPPSTRPWVFALGEEEPNQNRVRNQIWLEQCAYSSRNSHVASSTVPKLNVDSAWNRL